MRIHARFTLWNDYRFMLLNKPYCFQCTLQDTSRFCSVNHVKFNRFQAHYRFLEKLAKFLRSNQQLLLYPNAFQNFPKFLVSFLFVTLQRCFSVYSVMLVSAVIFEDYCYFNNFRCIVPENDQGIIAQCTLHATVLITVINDTRNYLSFNIIINI